MDEAPYLGQETCLCKLGGEEKVLWFQKVWKADVELQKDVQVMASCPNYFIFFTFFALINLTKVNLTKLKDVHMYFEW